MKKIFLLVFLLFLTGCSLINPDYKNIKVDRPDFGSGIVQVEISKDNILELEVEVARTDKQQSFGLMYINEIDKNKGMFFVYDNPSKSSFWMKNTIIPLDIIFIDQDYFIVDIFKNVPPCKSRKCKTYTPSSKSKYVLEVYGGFSDDNRLDEDSRVYPLILEE